MNEAPARSASQPERSSGPRARRGRRWGWVLFLAGLLVLAAWAGVTASRVTRHTRSLLAHASALEAWMQAGTDALSPAGLASAGQHLASLRADLDALQTEAKPFLPFTRLLSWVPVYGGDLASASHLLDMAVAVARAGDGAYRALAPALDSLEDPPGSSTSGERLLPALVAAQPQLEAAERELEAASASRALLDATRLSPRVAGLVEKLDRLLPRLGTALAGAIVSTDLLGADAPRTYLVVAQNNHELRPTGGFISGVGELTVAGGRIMAMNFSDSYAVDNLAVPHDLPPNDLRQTLFGELWLFRDSNWDADFPTSARRAIDFYARDRGVHADGVIALDLMALQGLLEAEGPIQVAGIDEPVVGTNAVQMLQELFANPSAGPALEDGGNAEWWQHRKDFVGEIAGAAIQRLLSGREIPLAGLARALGQALDEKHLLVYLSDPGAARLLRERNWDGALPDPAAPYDLLLVVDSNVGFNKTDPNVDRSIAYQVDLAGGVEAGEGSSVDQGYHAQVTVHYRHRATQPVGACVQEARYGDSYAEMMGWCYWDYVRIYAPAGSVLLQGPNLGLPPGSLLARSACPEGCIGGAPPDTVVGPPSPAGGAAVWPAFFDLEPMAERTLTFAYQLPGRVLSTAADGVSHYRLRVQKQPGTAAVPLRIEVRLPLGAEWIGASPKELWSMADGTLGASTDLRTDRTFEIAFRQGGMRP